MWKQKQTFLLLRVLVKNIPLDFKISILYYFKRGYCFRFVCPSFCLFVCLSVDSRPLLRPLVKVFLHQRVAIEVQLDCEKNSPETYIGTYSIFHIRIHIILYKCMTYIYICIFYMCTSNKTLLIKVTKLAVHMWFKYIWDCAIAL